MRNTRSNRQTANVYEAILANAFVHRQAQELIRRAQDRAQAADALRLYVESLRRWTAGELGQVDMRQVVDALIDAPA